MTSPRLVVGVDIGGTFTDVVVSDGASLSIHKLFSTPADPSQAMLAGIGAITGGKSARVAHGSTVATNAILERKGARTALLVTQGFRDVLWLGRQNRPDLYALHPTIPTPLIPRDWTIEVAERLDHTGKVLIPLDPAALEAALDRVAALPVDSVAVCLLYSFLNPTHERLIRDRLVERGQFSPTQIALSSDVLPEFREYERASTVALEAYVRPVMSGYLNHLEQRLPASAALRVMKSDGGAISAKAAAQRAIHTALSGPAAGVMGAVHIAKLAGIEQIITLDMGGTSTDVAVCPGTPLRRTDREIDGLPLRVRIIDIDTVGAGGGSIARLDAGGALRVGPESAGATPGSIIYGRGGTHITVSDANAILGRLDAAHFLGGQVRLDVDAARDALTALATAMELSVEQAARGIVQVANANIDRALRRVSIARGFDPRQFTLVAFGGAGPLHACEVADGLSISRVLIPRYPGVLCAFGLLVADLQVEHSRTVLGSATPLAAHLADLTTQAQVNLAREGVADDHMRVVPSLDVRYRGQAYELTIPFTDQITADFHLAHEQRYGFALRGRDIEIVTLRVQATGLTDKPVIRPEPVVRNDGGGAFLGEKVTANGKMKLFDRDRLSPGAVFDGPALVFQLDSTVFVPASWRVMVDGNRNMVVEKTSSKLKVGEG